MPEATCPSCGEPLPEKPGADSPVHINGTTIDFDELSYAERRQIKILVAELVKLTDPAGDPEEDYTQDDMRLAFAIVCARRTTPEFSIEDGLNLKPVDLLPPTTPPRKPAAAKHRRANGSST